MHPLQNNKACSKSRQVLFFYKNNFFSFLSKNLLSFLTNYVLYDIIIASYFNNFNPKTSKKEDEMRTKGLVLVVVALVVVGCVSNKQIRTEPELVARIDVNNKWQNVIGFGPVGVHYKQKFLGIASWKNGKINVQRTKGIVRSTLSKNIVYLSLPEDDPEIGRLRIRVEYKQGNLWFRLGPYHIFLESWEREVRNGSAVELIVGETYFLPGLGYKIRRTNKIFYDKEGAYDKDIEIHDGFSWRPIPDYIGKYGAYFIGHYTWTLGIAGMDLNKDKKEDVARVFLFRADPSLEQKLR